MTTAIIPDIEMILPVEFVASYKDFKVPMDHLGYVTYKRTYARPVVPESLQHIKGYHKQLEAWRALTGDPKAHFKTEEWYQTIERGVNWYLKTAKGAVSVEEGMELYDDLLNLRCSFAGRGLWQYGTETVDQLGAASLNNCYFVNVDSLESFLFTFDMLMLGGGVGFNVQKEYVFELPKVRSANVVRKESNDADFIVPDSREGWIELLRRTLEAYFETGVGFTYSTVCVRNAGSPIAGFGGTASGPEPLCEGIANICAILDSRVGKKLNPIDCMDVICIIGSIVVAGNVRRSATIALGDHEDTSYLLAKRFDLKAAVPNWRAMSNNTVVCNDIDHLPDKFWKTYEVGGEPYGLFNLNLSRSKGRLKDSHRKDPRISGTNPCGEISLESGESCNLAEVFLNRIEGVNELARVSRNIWKVCKVVSCVPHHWDSTNKVIENNHRTGLGVTGVLQVKEGQFENGLLDALDKAYGLLEGWDEEFSVQLTEALGRKIGTSIKLTTVKPSGTLSLVGGCTPGVHAAYSPFYIRRVRISSNSPILAASRNAGLFVEQVVRFDGSKDPNTYVVEFPTKTPEGTVLAKDMTAIKQLELVRDLQTYWADNAVSNTVYYHKEELPEIKEWLAENYNSGIKSCSFLLHSGHGFIQAPYEEITEKEYEQKTKNLKELDLSSSHDEMYDEDSCSTGSCPVR